MPPTGGEDWLEWNWSVEWEASRWAELRDRLQAAKTSAANGDGTSEEVNDLVTLGGAPAVVSPAGARLGRGSKGPYFPFRLQWQGLVLMIADREAPHETLPSVVVRADGLACLATGARRLWDRTGNLFASLGGAVVRERLSRIDACLDMPGQGIAPFQHAYLEGRYVTRAKVHETRHGNRGATISFGSDTLELRVYDKLAEIDRHRDEIKRSLMCFHRWSGIDPGAATRVEFQLRRQALTRRSVDTVEDYYRKRADVLDYLCRDWMRFTAEPPDRTHTTRAETMPLWERVRDGFHAWMGRPLGERLDPLPRGSYDVRMLARSMLGMATTAAARTGHHFASEEQLLSYVARHLRAEMRAKDWRKDLQRKHTRFAQEG